MALLLCVASITQENTVTGTIVSDIDGAPLPGATVKAKGTSRASQSNASGSYSFSILCRQAGFRTIEPVIKKVNNVADGLSCTSPITSDFGNSFRLWGYQKGFQVNNQAAILAILFLFLRFSVGSYLFSAKFF